MTLTHPCSIDNLGRHERHKRRPIHFYFALSWPYSSMDLRHSKFFWILSLYSTYPNTEISFQFCFWIVNRLAFCAMWLAYCGCHDNVITTLHMLDISVVVFYRSLVIFLRKFNVLHTFTNIWIYFVQLLVLKTAYWRIIDDQNLHVTSLVTLHNTHDIQSIIKNKQLN